MTFSAEHAQLHAAEAWYVIRGLIPEIKRQRHLQRLLYSQFVRPGDLCFDVGAHAGDRTRAFLALGASVVAVDPQPSCARRLAFAFRNNPRVSVISEALGEAPGEGELAVCDAAPTISTMSKRFREQGRFSSTYKWTRMVRVSVTTLDELIAHYGLPTFCKIDVEGFEVQVIRGLTQPVPGLSFEFGWDTLDETAACLEHLEKLGRLKVNYSLGESMLWALREWVDPPTLVDRLAEFLRSERVGGDVYVKMSNP